MNNKVWETIQKYRMLQPGDRIVVGLSGGADSCALLHYLCSIRKANNLTIYACHLHHGIRGKEADKDENFTRELCRELQVEYFVRHTDIPDLARVRRISEEACGREERYAFFSETAAALSAKIATAHTASDNTETILMHLLRGSGLTGLCGIPAVRRNIIRPLIEVTREEIETYCHDHQLSYVTDSTNFSREYTRNRLRLDVLPVLREINPSLDAVLTRQSEYLRETDRYLMRQAQEALRRTECHGGYDCLGLQQLEEPVFAAAVRILCGELSIIPEAKHIELMKQIVYNSGAVEIRNGIYAVAKQQIFRIVKKLPASKIVNEEFSWQKAGSDIVIHHKKIALSLLNIDEYHNRKKNNKLLFLFSLDYGTIPVSSVFRTRRSGDHFAPCGRGLTKPVRKLFQEQKIPDEQRDQIPLLADGKEVLWIDGIGVSERCRVTDQTEQVLLIRTVPYCQDTGMTQHPEDMKDIGKQE